MLRQFYEDMLPQNDLYKLIWTLQDKQSHWFQDINKAIGFIKSYNKDIFFGVGSTNKKLPDYKRAVANEIVCIRGLYSDIDIKRPHVHTKTKLPQDIDKAKEIVNSIAEPTWIINSGHGLHAYWLMNQWYYITKNNFEFITSLLRSWQREHNKRFPQFKLDATHDLPRILRCPGSMNCKDIKKKVLCEIITHNQNAYYEVEELEDAIEFSMHKEQKIYNMQNSETNSIPATQIATSMQNGKRLTKQECKQWLKDNDLVIAADRELDPETFNLLKSMEPEITEEMYNRTGRKSASEYQMRIANIAVKNGLPDQKVLDLLTQHRALNDHDPEINRIDKYVNDLIKAKRMYDIRRIDNTPNKKLSEEDKEAIREHLFNTLGVQIHTLWRYNKDPENVFELELSDCPDQIILMGTMAECIMSQNKFTSRIIDTVNQTPKRINNKLWYQDVVKKITKLTRNGITQEDASYKGQVKMWIKEFLSAKDVLPDLSSYIENHVKSSPFWHDGRIYFHFDTLVNWIKTTKSANNFDPFYFNINMGKHGFMQTDVEDEWGNKINLWKTPQNYLTRRSDEPAEI